MSYYKMFMESKFLGFFELPLEEQDKLKKDHPEWGEEYELLLYKRVFGLSGYPLEELNEMDVDPYKELEFNTHKLKYYGMGKDQFQLVTGYEPKQAIDYKTLYNYDYGFFQKRIEVVKSHLGESEAEKRGYHLQLLDVYARAIIEEENGEREFKYLFINSLDTYLSAELESTSIELIEELVPHEYIATNDYGKRITEGDMDYNLLSYKVDANGKESILQDLQKLAQNYLSQKEEEFRKAFIGRELNKVFVKEKEDEFGDEVYYYITTPETAKELYFENWNDSLKKYIDRDFSQIEEWVKEENVLLEDYLRKKHEELMENFDPSIISLNPNKVELAISDEHLQVLSEMVETASYELEEQEEIKKAKDKLEKKSILSIVKDEEDENKEKE